VLKPQNNSLVFAIAHLSLSLVFIYFACLYCLSPYVLDISCALLIYVWDCLIILVFNKESHSGTSTLNLEES